MATNENQIPITYFVNASAVTPQAGLSPLKVNTILVLTDEQPVAPIATDYTIHLSAGTVSSTYGANAEVTSIANTIFSQTPNLLAGHGYLIVASFKNQNSQPTAGTLTTPVLQANLDAIKAVTQGYLNLSVNGIPLVLNSFDFSEATTLTDVANILNQQLTDVTATALNNTIKFTSNFAGAVSSVTAAPYANIPIITPEVVATAGHLTTTEITSAMINEMVGDNGVVPLVVDGENFNITGIKISTDATIEEVVTAINTALEEDADPKVTVELVPDNMISFTSKTTGANSTVTYNSSWFAAGTNLGTNERLDLEIAASIDGTAGTPAVYAPDLYAAEYLDLANGVAVQGTDAVVETKETYAEAITRIQNQIYAECIMTVRDVEEVELLQAAEVVNATQQNILIALGTQLSDIQDGGLLTKLTNFNFVKPLYYSYGETDAEIKLNAKKFAAAYLSRLCAVDYSGSATTLNMNLKDLQNVPADTNIDLTLLNLIKGVGADCYASVAGLSKVICSKHNNFFIDQLTNQIWFVNGIKINVFNVLATTATKIGQSNAEMLKLVNAVRKVCEQGISNNYIGAGNTWNSPDTFGNLEDFMRNITDFGYYIYHLPVAEQLQSERADRIAPPLQVAAKELGAVNSANILVYIEP